MINREQYNLLQHKRATKLKGMKREIQIVGIHLYRGINNTPHHEQATSALYRGIYIPIRGVKYSRLTNKNSAGAGSSSTEKLSLSCPIRKIRSFLPFLLLLLRPHASIFCASFRFESRCCCCSTFREFARACIVIRNLPESIHLRIPVSSIRIYT